MLSIRDYRKEDFPGIERVHDEARREELRLASLLDAFLPLRIAAEREDLFSYPGLFVAELDGEIAGFAACTEEELAWLYVAPARSRRGVGTALARHALQRFPGIRSIEVLVGNAPARALYEKLGFHLSATESGAMPGNEAFRGSVWLLVRD